MTFDPMKSLDTIGLAHCCFGPSLMKIDERTLAVQSVERRRIAAKQSIWDCNGILQTCTGVMKYSVRVTEMS